MENDARYKAVKILIESGYIDNFVGIFSYLPKSVLGSDIGINNNRLTRLIGRPEQFSIQELNSIAALMGVEPLKIINLIYSQIEINKNNRKQLNGKRTKKISFGNI